MTVCSRKGCPYEARWFPKLNVYAERHDSTEGHRPAEAVIDLPLCGPCTRKATLGDFVTDEGWTQIETTLISRGYAKPDRKSLVLGFERIQKQSKKPW